MERMGKKIKIQTAFLALGGKCGERLAYMNIAINASVERTPTGSTRSRCGVYIM